MITYTVKVSKDRTEWFNEQGERHREDGPAIEYAGGSKFWYLNDKRHRTDGPAIEYADGSKSWFLNGEWHRTDGPAIERADGSASWYLNGKRHRTDGPAIERADGSASWYLNGKQLTEKEFLARTPTCEGKVVEIDGKKYRLTEV